MHIPSIDENIRKLMGCESEKTSIDKSRMRDGPPLFTRDDIIDAQNLLDVQLRSIFDSFHIGKTYFNDKSVEYYQSRGRTRDQAKSDTQNLVRTLEKGDITDNRFEETLATLGLTIVDRSITVQDTDGDLYTFSTAKTLKENNITVC